MKIRAKFYLGRCEQYEPGDLIRGWLKIRADMKSKGGSLKIRAHMKTKGGSRAE